MKKLIRKIFFARSGEKLADTMTRHKYKVLSKLPYTKYTIDDLESALLKSGVQKGDCLMIHCSWRAFIGFSGNPYDVINLFTKLLGSEGTLLMPANDVPKSKSFDAFSSPNVSGVLSKCFCEDIEVKRSIGSHFSVAGKGALATELLSSHIKSEYGFDDYSPYGKFCQVPNSKVFFLGLGRTPVKISLFHRITYLLRNEENYKELYKKNDDYIVFNDSNEAIKVPTLTRVNVTNSSSNIRKIFSAIPKEAKSHVKLGHLDIVTINSKESLLTGIKLAKSGLTMYK